MGVFRFEFDSFNICSHGAPNVSRVAWWVLLGV